MPWTGRSLSGRCSDESVRVLGAHLCGLPGRGEEDVEQPVPEESPEQIPVHEHAEPQPVPPVLGGGPPVVRM